MKNIKAITGILLVFILGAFSGAIVMHIIDRSPHESSTKGGTDTREEEIISRLTRKLGLDTQQQVQVRVIIHENHAAIRQIRNQSQPQIQAVLKQGQERISDILRPDQQEKFHQIIENLKKNRSPENAPTR